MSVIVSVAFELISKFISSKHKTIFTWLVVANIIGCVLSIQASTHLSNNYTDEQIKPVKSSHQLDSIRVAEMIRNQNITNERMNNMSNRVDDIYKMMVNDRRRR